MNRALAIAFVVLAVSPAFADDVPPPPPDVPPPVDPPPVDPLPPPQPDPRIEELEARIEELEDRDRDRERDVGQLDHGEEATRQRVEDLVPVAHMLSAYLDAGFFVTGGDGSGIRPDIGHMAFREYIGKVPAQWVLMGDPLSTAINARGEPADLGPARAVTDDTIDSAGNPAFIANAIGLRLQREVGGGFALAAGVEVLPRGRDARFTVQNAAVTYLPREDRKLRIAVGKVDSILGVEYRNQDAPERMTVTPSLACRYTCGRPIGVQVRQDDERWSAAVAVTSGDSFVGDDELVASTLPTVSARASMTFPLAAPARLTIGVSGAVGPQDRQPDDDLTQWHVGVDARLRNFHDLDVTAEYVQGELPGADEMGAPPDGPRCGLAECLHYKAAYLLVGWRSSVRFQPYVRVDWRDALHEHGGEFVYISNVMRVTAGVRVTLNRFATAKVEYTYNRELGRIPQFPDDVLTTSVVVSTD